MDYTELVKMMSRVIMNTVEKKIKSASFNTTVKGRIVSVLGNNTYKALINGKTYTVKSRFSHSVNDTVIIVKCNNNMNNLYVIY